MRERPAGLKVEAEEPVKRRTLENVVQAVQVKKETWFRKGNKKERKVFPKTKDAVIADLSSVPALHLLLSKGPKGRGENVIMYFR